MSDMGSILQIFVGAVLLGCLVYFSPKYVPMTTYNLAGIAAVALLCIGIVIHGFLRMERAHTPMKEELAVQESISQPVMPSEEHHEEQHEEHQEEQHVSEEQQ